MSKTINLDYLVQAALNDREFIITMLKIFLKNSPEYCRELSNAYESKILEELNRAAHKFKSAVNIMGITPLHETLDFLENTNELTPSTDLMMENILIIVEDARKEVNHILEDPDRIPV